MAITAKFLADFDQFVGETKRADAALDGIGTSAKRVTTEASASFNNMGAVVRNLAGAFGIGLSIGAVVQFGRSVFDAASGIHDMALKLGISAEAVQGFKFAAEQAGSSIDVVGTSITRMNVNLSEGEKGTVSALRAAGLEFSAIRSMKPEDAFLAITDAIQRIPDPMLRSEVALQLFGKSAAELLPAITEGFRAASDGASKMSDETIASLEKAQDAWSKVGNTFTIVTGTMIAKALEFWGTLREQNFGLLGTAAKTLKGDIELLPPVIHQTKEELTALTEEKKKAEKAADALAVAVKKEAAAWDAWLSDLANKAGLEKMNDDIATQAREVENLTGKWLMDRDAYQLAQAEKAKALELVVAQEKVAAVEHDRLMEGMVTVIGNIPPAFAAAGAAAVSSAQATEMSWGQAMASVTQGLGVMTGTIQNATGKGGVTRYDDYNNPYTYVPGVNAPGKAAPARAGGGPVSGGQSYMVGERGPELYTPGASGFITPNSGGSVVNNTFYVNGTGEDVGRQAMDYITKTMKVGRKWPAA